MTVRAYLLLDMVDGSFERMAQALRDKPGVMIADSLEGHPDVIVVMEADDRRKLAELIMPAISLIENVTEELHLLVTRDNALCASHKTDLLLRMI